MVQKNFDADFLKNLRIQEYKPESRAPATPKESTFIATIEEVIQNLGITEDVFHSWRHSGKVTLPKSEYDYERGDCVYHWTSDQISALQKLRESYAKATITQKELLEERGLTKTAREATDRLREHRWDIAARLACGAAIEDGPLSAKFDGNGGLRVR